MSFDYTTLITDRTEADAARVKALAAKGWAAMTEAERAEWAAEMKGAYNAGDLNRVSACLEDLVARFRALGYRVPGYERVEVQRNASRLPEGYTEVEYIQSSGTQCIDTGFLANNNTRAVMDIDILKAAQAAIMGGRTAANAYSFTVWMLTETQFRSDYGGSSATMSNGTVGSMVGRYIVDKNKASCTVNGVTVSNASDTFSCAYDLYLLSVNTAGTLTTAINARLYSCQIYDNGTLVRDFVPCIDPSGAVGLYDLVNDQFYANAGTGTFTAGDAVAAASDSDEELDPYTWYETDAPTENQMEQYRGNVAAVRRVVAQAASTPTTPESMAGLTVDTANDIETILADTDRLVTNISKAWYYSGDAYAGEI